MKIAQLVPKILMINCCENELIFSNYAYFAEIKKISIKCSFLSKIRSQKLRISIKNLYLPRRTLLWLVCITEIKLIFPLS